MEGISIRNVSFAYGRNTKILDDVSVKIKKGSFTGIAGANGSGKTTFSYLLNGIIPHYFKGQFEGEVIIDEIFTREKSISYLSQKVGMLFQNPDFSLFNLTVEEEIGFTLNNFEVVNTKEKINKSLKEVGLSGFAQRDPQSLSFGEKQKVNLASLLSYEPDYLILDEPSAMLDYKSSVDLYQLLRKLNKNGKTIIVIEHDTDFLWEYSDYILIFDKGNVIKYGKVKEILGQKKSLNSLGIKVPKYVG